MQFFQGGAGTLFAKFWLVCRLVRLGNVCGCEALALVSFTFLLVCLQILRSGRNQLQLLQVRLQVLPRQ